jgi:hypothetical protein
MICSPHWEPLSSPTLFPAIPLIEGAVIDPSGCPCKVHDHPSASQLCALSGVYLSHPGDRFCNFPGGWKVGNGMYNRYEKPHVVPFLGDWPSYSGSNSWRRRRKLSEQLMISICIINLGQMIS